MDVLNLRGTLVFQKKPIFVIEDNIIKAEKLPLPQKNEYLNEILLENLKKNPEFVGQVSSVCVYIFTF